MLDELNTAGTIAGLLGVSVEYFWQKLEAHRKKNQEALAQGKTAATLAAAQRLAVEGLGAQFATRYYGDAVLASAGLQRYSVEVDGQLVQPSLATCGDWVGRRLALRSDDERCELVGSVAREIRPDPSDTAAILATIQALGLKIWNAPCYRTLDVGLTGERIEPKFCVDDFYRYRFTNGALHDEMAQALVDADYDLARIVGDSPLYLPRRQRYLPADASLSALDRRFSVAGINLLCAFARPAPHRDFAIIVQRRGTAVSSRQGALSVLPAGMHQPTLEPEVEVQLSRTMMRELYEEVFGGEEIERGAARLQVDWYERECEPLGWFGENEGAFTLTLTGAATSLLTGSLTFCGVLMVRNERFWSQFCHKMRTNWEASTQARPIVSSKDEAQLRQLLLTVGWMDYSYQALVEGLLYLREQEPKRVNIPKIARSPSPRPIRFAESSGAP